MDQKQSIATGIALQAQVLKLCPVHTQLFCDEEADPAVAFALAAQLIRQDVSSAKAFQPGIHELADLLSEIISAAPSHCPQCANPAAESRS